jgi:hypothetical protein
LPPGQNKDIGLRIKGKVGTGEEAIGLVLAVKQRDVRLDLMPHQPPDHQTRSVGGISGQPLRFEPEAVVGPLELVLVAATSAVQRAGVASTSTMIARRVSIR